MDRQGNNAEIGARVMKTDRAAIAKAKDTAEIACRAIWGVMMREFNPRDREDLLYAAGCLTDAADVIRREADKLENE